MRKYGDDLQQYISNLHKQGLNINTISILNLGIQLLDRLEIIHSAGFIFNDIKLENILIGHNQSLPEITSENIKNIP